MTRSALLLLSLAILPACESAPLEGDTDAEGTATNAGLPQGPCVPGQSLACGCGAEMGAATCRADGSGYDECSCDGSQSGGQGSAGPGSGDGQSSDPTSPTSADGSDSGLPSGDSSGSAEVSWTLDVVPLLYSACGADVVGCHNREVYNPDVNKGCLNWASFEDVPLGATFTSGERLGQATGCPDLPLYERVVGRSPWQCGAFFNDPQATLVVPGDPDGSYVIQKIRGITCDSSLQMPPAGQDIQITQAEVDVLIEWIAAGAPYDG